MHVALLFPPAADPRGPHLALPSLAAFLRGHGIRTTVRDVDLEAFLHLLSAPSLAEAARRCKERLDAAPDDSDRLRLRRALELEDHVLANAPHAADVLRDPVTFYQPHRLMAARELIVQAMSLVSAAAGPVEFSIGPIRYDVAGVDIGRLTDLAAATADPSYNLFDTFYRTEVLADLERERPDVVGISIVNHQQVLPGLMLARLLKQHGHTVIIGGTVYAKFIPALRSRPQFFSLFCDGLVPYEGETAMLRLLESLDGGHDWGAVPNLLHLNRHGEVEIGPTHLEDVSSLPTPDFTGLALDNYLLPEPVLPILTGKGCYFNRCKFCDIPFINAISSRPYRRRSPAQVAADVATLHQRHGARFFEITDEALAPRFLRDIGEELKNYPGIEPRFVGYARLEPGFNAETCRQLHDMGVRKLFFGLESGSQATLDHTDKGIRLDAARQVLRNCGDAGINFHLFSIVGFPEETEERARETLRFFLEEAEVIADPRNSFDVHGFSLDLRTEYFDQAERFGIEYDHAELAARDFPLNVPAWTNTRGIDQDTTRRLLDEFQDELRRAFPDHRVFPAHLWPGFEEYSILYAEKFDGRPFPYRLALPRPGDPMAFRLVWAESVELEASPGGYTVRCLTGKARIGSGALDLLARPTPHLPVDDLLDQLLDRLADSAVAARGRDPVELELREIIDSLLATGALRLEPAPAPLAQ